MWSHYLASGEHIRLHDGPYVIDNLLDETAQVQLRHEKTGALKNLSRREFLEDHSHGDLVFVSPDAEEGAGERQPLAKKVFERPLSELPQRCRKDTIRRQGYLRRLERRDALHFGRGRALEDAVQEIAAELGDPTPPSRSSIQRWYRKWVARRRDYRAVTCRIDRRGAPGEGRFCDEVETEVAEVIDDYYLTLERPSIKDAHAELKRRIEALNRSRPGDDLLPVPCERTLDRRIAKLNQYEVVARREGERAAKRRFRAVTGVVHVKRILERVEMDHTPLNLFVVDDETFLPQGRPYLTVALDKKSRCLLGYWVSFTGHGADAVLMCLRHAILAKTDIQQKYPHISLDWPCHGVPMGLGVDNGTEFTGEDLANACAALGIDLYFMPARRPQWKGSVERFVGRFNHGLIHRIPGTTFESITARKDYDPTKHALITLSDLERLITTWVCDEYHNQVHRGLGARPIDVWQRDVEAEPVAMIDDVSRLDFLLGESEERTLWHYGVELFGGQRYNSADLASIHASCGRVRVRVRYQRCNIGRVWVEDPVSKDFIEVPNIDLQYAQGLTLEQHDFIRGRAKADAEGRVNHAALMAAKAYIQDEIRRLLHSKSIRSRSKAARMAGQNSGVVRGEAVDIRKEVYRSQCEAEQRVRGERRRATRPTATETRVPHQPRPVGLPKPRYAVRESGQLS